MTRRLRRCYGASIAEALWRKACASAIARRLRKRSEETLRTRCGATPAEVLWRDACVTTLARGLRKRTEEKLRTR